jgi:hypothetical protein
VLLANPVKPTQSLTKKTPINQKTLNENENKVKRNSQ